MDRSIVGYESREVGMAIKSVNGGAGWRESGMEILNILCERGFAWDIEMVKLGPLRVAQI